MPTDPMHILSFHVNHFLSTPQGRQLIDSAIKPHFPELHEQLMNAIDNHKNVMQQIAKQNPAIKLDDNNDAHLDFNAHQSFFK